MAEESNDLGLVFYKKLQQAVLLTQDELQLINENYEYITGDNKRKSFRIFVLHAVNKAISRTKPVTVFKTDPDDTKKISEQQQKIVSLEEQLKSAPTETDSDLLKEKDDAIDILKRRVLELEAQVREKTEPKNNVLILTLPDIFIEILDKAVAYLNKQFGEGKYNRENVMINLFWSVSTEGAKQYLPQWSKAQIEQLKEKYRKSAPPKQAE